MNTALLAALRIGVGLLWMRNASWKDPGTGFGALREFTGWAIQYEVLPPYAWLVDRVVLPNFTFFGWAVLLVESALGGFLLVGLATRLWAAIGVAQTAAISLSVLNAPNEWPWAYVLMLLAHLAILATAAGRHGGLDGVLRPVWQRSPGRLARLMGRVS